MNVLSLFDGISCGQIALNEAGIEFDNYYASEIDKDCIKVTMKNYPDTIQLGDVQELNSSNLPKIDLLFGGSPCQGFSFAGKQLNFDDERSKLFFEFVRLKNELKPKYFLLENVRMRQEFQDVISEYMGCKPVEINSKRFVPQNRPRLYWTNIPIKDIEDVDCCLSDILLPDETEFLDKFKLSEKGIDYMSRLRNGKPRWDYHTNPLNGNAACLTANMYKGIPYGVIKEKMRRLHPIECERLQGVPDNYTDNVSNSQRLKAIGNGWTVNVIRHIFEGLKPVKKKVNKKLNVLSLFDGMSCGQIALGRAGIDVENYYSSEIDKHAIKETMINYPDTIQVGDVTKIVASDLPKIDLLIGGSPCQGFSFSGKQLNFEDPRSKLFFEFVRLLKECEPTYFLLENVVMKKEYEQVITDYLGVEPIQVNSTLVSAQNRVRLYWTNIPNVGQPDDKNITLMDILEDGVMIGDTIVRPEDLNKGTILGRRLNKDGKRDDYNKTIPIVQCLEVRASNRGKSNCITTVAKDNVLTTLPIGRHVDAFNRKLPFRYYTTTEYCRLQTVPDDYFKVSSDNQIRKMIGNGWTVDVIAHIFNGLKE